MGTSKINLLFPGQESGIALVLWLYENARHVLATRSWFGSCHRSFRYLFVLYSIAEQPNEYSCLEARHEEILHWSLKNLSPATMVERHKDTLWGSMTGPAGLTSPCLLTSQSSHFKDLSTSLVKKLTNSWTKTFHFLYMLSHYTKTHCWLEFTLHYL